MLRKVSALAAIGLSASACSTVQIFPHHQASTPKDKASAAPYSGSRCGPGTPCAPKAKSPHRQYFDTRHQRYYYYDPVAHAYYWEDGSPKT